LRVTDDGELEILGNIDEGSYSFDIVAVDYGPNSTTVLKDRSKVIYTLYNNYIFKYSYTFLTKDFTKNILFCYLLWIVIFALQVYMFIDNIAACNSDTSKFIRAFSKHYITEETKLITAVPGTESSGQCRFSISHQYPFGGKYTIIIHCYVIQPETITIKYII